ncbi:MAG: hypothetical protein KBS81_05050 [Spirochaetales bacterium]|nr:hypothetical protein [Candidatus Physcosoma equi]
MRKVTYLILFLLLLLFSSCEKEINYKSYINSNSYQELYEVTTTQLEKSLSTDALYYKAVACYYLDKEEECANLTNLCLKLSSDDRTRLLKMLLYKGALDEACTSGAELYQLNVMNSSDKVQYYRVLLKNNQMDTARSLIDELHGILTPYEYAYAVVTNKYPTQTMLDATLEVYRDEGITTRFLTLTKEILTIGTDRLHDKMLEAFIDETFDGSPQYALILGDFYYDNGYKNKALSYWAYIKDLFPTAYATRVGSFN